MERLSNLFRLILSRALAVAIFLGRVLRVLPAVPPTVLSRPLRRLPTPDKPAPRGGRRPRVLLVGGTINHTTQVQQIAAELPEFEHAYTWYYCDGVLELFRRFHMLESTALGDKLRARCIAYLKEHRLPLDLGG